jgi:hypothetical protein
VCADGHEGDVDLFDRPVRGNGLLLRTPRSEIEFVWAPAMPACPLRIKTLFTMTGRHGRAGTTDASIRTKHEHTEGRNQEARRC